MDGRNQTKRLRINYLVGKLLDSFCLEENDEIYRRLS